VPRQVSIAKDAQGIEVLGSVLVPLQGPSGEVRRACQSALLAVAINEQTLLNFIQDVGLEIFRNLRLEQLEAECVDCPNEHLGGMWTLGPGRETLSSPWSVVIVSMLWVMSPARKGKQTWFDTVQLTGRIRLLVETAVLADYERKTKDSK